MPYYRIVKPPWGRMFAAKEVAGTKWDGCSFTSGMASIDPVGMRRFLNLRHRFGENLRRDRRNGKLVRRVNR